MNKKTVESFEKLFEEKQIPYMQITTSKDKNVDLIIKVYFPKIVVNICKFFNDKFILENRENIVLEKDQDGYHKVDLVLNYEGEKIKVRIHSMLKNTWGIVNKL